ncbi:MAG: HAMP domain-containing protein, partial [Deltaproteobacteria bacterium]|nr:HAMP domain-containing protein [Deltaproteobacteria bacterium]
MRMPLRTLSARILLGFAILILTFAGVILVMGGNMYVLTKQIRVIPEGYLQLALIGKDAVEKQKSLRDYVRDEIGEEAKARRARARIRRLRDQRDRLLKEARATLAGLRDVPSSHSEWLDRTGEILDDIESHLQEVDSHYKVLLANPPLTQVLQATDLSDEQRELLEESRKAQRTIIRLEGLLYNKMHKLARHQRTLVTRTANKVADNERRVRLYAILLGGVAVAVALVIALWVTMTLRPLRRLQQAAQRIARGDYASRIDEKGPSEVADLAHEFNVMGRAIEEREREMVRNERLAAVGRMAAMITHEVRNPLSSIGLNTELLEEELAGLDEAETAEARALCRSINTEVDRLTEITEEYLKFARLPKPKLQRENINTVVTDLVEFERESLRKMKVEVELSLDDDLPEVLIDDSQIRQALLNLVRNAAEALEEHEGRG